MVTRNKITNLIAIIKATIISYQKSTRQKSKIITRWTYKSCMERGVELQARYPDARHTSDTSQQPVRRPPNKPTKKVVIGQPTKTRMRPATPKHDPAPRWRTRDIFVSQMRC